MALKKRQDEGGGGDSWLNTYADMITLILTFFVALLGMSNMDQEAFDSFKEAMEQAIPPTESVASGGDTSQPGEGLGTEIDIADADPGDFKELYEYIVQYVKENGMQGDVQVSENQDTIFIRFNNNIFFGANQYALKEASLPILDFLGKCLLSIEQDIMMVNVYGHTASVVNNENYPVSSRMLSSQRAANVAIFFEDVTHFDRKKLNSMGLGNNFPVAKNDTTEGREANRRVDIAIVSDKAKISGAQEVLKLLQGTYEVTNPEQAGTLDVLNPYQASGETQPTPESGEGAADSSAAEEAPEEDTAPPAGSSTVTSQ